MFASVKCRKTFYSKGENLTIALGWMCDDCRRDRERQDVLSHANVLETVLGIWKLFRMLGMITLSNANIVCTNGMKAGVQIWHKLSTKIFESIRYVRMFHSIKIQA